MAKKRSSQHFMCTSVTNHGRVLARKVETCRFAPICDNGHGSTLPLRRRRDARVSYVHDRATLEHLRGDGGEL